MRIGSSWDTGWPVVLTTVGMLAFLLGLTPTGHQMCGDLVKILGSRQPPSIVIERNHVLVVSARSIDQVNVVATVTPRGYNVLVAENVPAGVEKLIRDAGNIGVIVVDSSLRDSPVILRMARQLSPAPRIVALKPDHTATDLATLLLRNIEN